nr:J524 [uncultured bacterium]
MVLDALVISKLKGMGRRPKVSNVAVLTPAEKLQMMQPAAVLRMNTPREALRMHSAGEALRHTSRK